MAVFSFECLFIEKNVFYYFKEIQAMAKKLLKEAVVRRFQSLANIKPINEMYDTSYQEEKKEEEMEMDAEEEMADADEEAPVEMAADEEAVADEAPMAMDDVELTDEEAQALIALGDKLSSAMGDAAEDVMDADEPMDAEEAEEAPEEEEEEDLMANLSEVELSPVTQSEIVNEVARRVARRLAVAQKAQKKMNEALGRK